MGSYGQALRPNCASCGLRPGCRWASWLRLPMSVSRGYICHVEHGQRWPSRPVVKALDAALEAGEALLGVWELGEKAGANPARKPGRVTPSAGPLTTAALGMPLADVVTVRGMALAFQTADRQLGGGWVYPTVLRYLHTEIAPALVDTGDADSAKMFAAAASLIELAGWMAHDAGRDTAARAHFSRAYRLATAADSDPLIANVCASMSHLAGQLGRSDDAVRIAEAGLVRARRADDVARLVARLHAMQAHGLALRGNTRGAIQALYDAERALASAQGTEHTEWIAHFDEGSLAGEAALCLLRLGDQAGAERAAERAIELRDGDRVCSRAFGQLTLARVLVHAGRPEEAAALGSAVCAVAPLLSSARVHTQLSGLGTHREVADVATFLGQLVALRPGSTPEDPVWPV